MDPFEAFKNVQKQSWAHFAPLEMATMLPAVRLVKFAGVHAGQRVLDVGCGTGVVALTSARMGAKVTGLDLTPELLGRARFNSEVAGLDVDWHEGDAEKLPFADASFDVVLSQYGHMFAPRPEVAVSEMLRVLKPGGTIAFSTWPPDLLMGRLFALIGSYMPPPPPGVSSPVQWGDPAVIRQRLGSAVRDVTFDTATMNTPALSARHFRVFSEKTVGPVIKVVEMLEKSDPARLETFRRDYDALAGPYFQDNTLQQGFLMTRAVKH
jgi:ubiquinone/menaquinone biosynthesis C-methylase UbiE